MGCITPNVQHIDNIVSSIDLSEIVLLDVNLNTVFGNTRIYRDTLHKISFTECIDRD